MKALSQSQVDTIRAKYGDKFADMVASRMAPGTKGSDRAFMEGRVLDHGIGDMPIWQQEMVVKQAKKAGVDITGKTYVAGLAEGKGGGNPLAWVSDSGDVVKACEIQNLNCRGSVNYRGHDVEVPEVPLAEHLIKESIAEDIAENPDLAMRPIQELREKAIHEHGNPSYYQKTKDELRNAD